MSYSNLSTEERIRLARQRARNSAKDSKPETIEPGSAKYREQIQLELLTQLLKGEISEGQLLKGLRKEVLGFSQERFAKMVDVSRKTISDLEGDKGSPSLQILNSVFKPFGLKAGIIPRSLAMTEKMIERTASELELM